MRKLERWTACVASVLYACAPAGPARDGPDGLGVDAPVATVERLRSADDDGSVTFARMTWNETPAPVGRTPAGPVPHAAPLRMLEIRSYTLVPGTRDTFHRLVVEESLPLLARHAVDVVAYGPSRHDEDSYFLIRAFDSLEDRRATEDAFYGSAEWREGPRERILALIEGYTTVVVPLDAAVVEALRNALVPEPREGAQGGYEVELSRLAPGVWLHTSWYAYPDGARVPSNGLVIRDGDDLLLIDTAWGELATERLLERIDRELGRSVTTAIITHSHYDRIAGVDLLRRRGVAVVAHPTTRRLANEQGLPPPDTVAGLAEPGSVVAVGAVELFYPGPGHAPDNLMVWIAEAGVLFGGCAVRAASSASAGNLAHADLEAWPDAIRRALERYGSAETVVPGHGESGGADLLRHTLELVSGR